MLKMDAFAFSNWQTDSLLEWKLPKRARPPHFAVAAHDQAAQPTEHLPLLVSLLQCSKVEAQRRNLGSPARKAVLELTAGVTGASRT